MKKNSMNGLMGRLVVLTKSKDNCKNGRDFDEIADIYGVGLLSIYKTQAITNNSNGKEDYLIREINSIDKENFDRMINKDKIIPSKHALKATPTPSASASKKIDNTSTKVQPAPQTHKETEKDKPKKFFDLNDIFKIEENSEKQSKPKSPQMVKSKRLLFPAEENKKNVAAKKKKR